MELKELAVQPLTFRKKVFKLVGKSISGMDAANNQVVFVKQKGFKLKEDIRAYTNKDQTEELLYIQARQILDISAAYDVVDSRTQEKVGALRRKGLKSTFLRDEWDILDSSDQPVGKIQEDSMAMALIRRFLTNLIPQSYDFSAGETKVAKLKQRFNPFVFKADYKVDVTNAIDPRMILAGSILLMCIEGRQG